MNKSQFYLSECADAASKSTMYYTLGSVIVKGGKVISRGYNHQRPKYDCQTTAAAGPVSMHAEMASIFNATRGQAPARKQQIVQQRDQNHKYQNNYHKSNYNAVREVEEPRRDLDSHRKSGYKGYKAKWRGVFPPTPHHPHHQDQESDPACEKDGSADRPTRDGAGKSRARYSKLNGCDLYVCRITKNGEFGCSKPCWRCIDWCWWAGIRRIFHWSAEEGRFICLKVGDASKAESYQTIADLRLLNSRASWS